jgi:catechol 2,3-dioxygenase-like lactoylglutathione lyase family enzyme
MQLRRLDHVALWVSERDAIADFAVAYLGMHVIERTERFTLVGANARRGKLTLFAADGQRDKGALEAVGLRVSDLASALQGLPEGYGEELELADGLRLRLVEAPTETEYDLDHVALRTADPGRAAGRWLELGFEDAGGEGSVRRVEAAGAALELRPGTPVRSERPLLNHLGVLVDAADEWKARAERAGAEVADIVDAPNTYAVFVWGPEQVKLEYVEHKPGFALE